MMLEQWNGSASMDGRKAAGQDCDYWPGVGPCPCPVIVILIKVIVIIVIILPLPSHPYHGMVLFGLVQHGLVWMKSI